MTTMCEYFETGRVSTLAGPDGAYNLYESEVRQDIIINKLDIVIDKLDTIIANQSMLYEAIIGVADKLDTISGKMDAALNEIGAIGSSLETIETMTAVTAYNTYKTALYSKMNAELTNSLGYLIALK